MKQRLPHIVITLVILALYALPVITEHLGWAR
jgi:hypothetical protein